MIKMEEMEYFIREGLKIYPDAKDTIETFEEEIKNHLKRLLKGKKDWSHFRPKADVEIGRIITQKGDAQRWIDVYLSSSDDNGGSIDIGIWWRWPGSPDKPILYSQLWRDRLQMLRLSNPKTPVQCKPLEQNRESLFIVIEDKFDLEKMGLLLLAETDRALGENVEAR